MYSVAIYPVKLIPPGHNEIEIESRSNGFKILHHFYEYFTKQPEWPMNTSSSVMKMHCGKVQ